MEAEPEMLHSFAAPCTWLSLPADAGAFLDANSGRVSSRLMIISYRCEPTQYHIHTGVTSQTCWVTGGVYA